MKITPEGNVLLSFCYAPLSWRLALGELIDNAFDSGANAVAVSFERGVLQVRDDGHGCPSLAKLLTLGARLQQDSTVIGRYGIGVKDAVLWIGGLDSWLDLQSTHGGITRLVSINWKDAGEREWEVPDPQERPAALGECGTTLAIRPSSGRFNHEPPQGAKFEDLVEALGYLYHPALRQGRQITIRGPRKGAHFLPIKAWAAPPLDGDTVDCTITVGGRSAHVFCGVLREGTKTRHAGMTYNYGFRVVVEASARGCGDFGHGSVCGIVDLDDRWTLAKNKNDIAGDADDLYTEVERVCRPVLERASKSGPTLQSAALLTAASKLLNESIKRKPEPRPESPPTPEPTTEPTPEIEGVTPIREEKTPPIDRRKLGERLRSGSRGGWRIVPVERGVVHEIGEVKRPAIEVNVDNPWVGKTLREGNAVALAVIAASLLGADYCLSDQRQLRLRGIDRRDFSGALGTILSGDLNIGGHGLESLEKRTAGQ